MNGKRFFFAFLAGFIFIFGWSFIYNGVILRDAYVGVTSLFRPREEMMGLFHWMALGQAIMALAFVMIYASGFAGGGIAAGVRLGLLLEVLAIGARLMIYAAQPFPASLMALWTLGGFVEMIGTGVIVGAIYKPSVSASQPA